MNGECSGCRGGCTVWGVGEGVYSVRVRGEGVQCEGEGRRCTVRGSDGFSREHKLPTCDSSL